MKKFKTFWQTTHVLPFTVCQNGHIVHKWCSQPILNRGMHSGDMMIAASVVLSGSNFQKKSMFAKYLKLPILSKSTLFKIQRHYVIPSVNEYWIDHQDAILDSFRGQDLIILWGWTNGQPRTLSPVLLLYLHGEQQ